MQSRSPTIRMPYQVLLVAGLLMLAGAGSTVAPRRASADEAGHATPSQSHVSGHAQRRLTPARGGRVRLANGAELRVPKGVMRRRGVVSIRQIGPSRFNMHIAAPWKGTVTVTLPVAAGITSLAHRTRRGWIIEAGRRLANGRARVRVRSLSVFDTREQLRYAIETMNLPYTAFLARKADFERSGCSEPRFANDCRKPPPYHAYNWTDDGCSPSFIPNIRLPIGTSPPILYRHLFDGPCKQHDFGYRNFGNGPRLGRDETTRDWIDGRFLQEMGRLCTDTFSHPLQTANEFKCKSDAGYIWAFLRHFGRSILGMSAFYGPPEPGPPPRAPETPIAQPPSQPAGLPSPTSQPTPQPTPSPQPPNPVRVRAFDNYGPANAGRAMCRGNPSQPLSMPGGTASQTFTVPPGVASIDHVLVQIDPDNRVTGHGSLIVNGAVRATATAAAVGDTNFSFARVPVAAGNTAEFRVSFTATFGKIITVYTAGSPGGVFTASNSCPDGAPNVSTGATGLRAVVFGWNR
jgi:hypothetical protein